MWLVGILPALLLSNFFLISLFVIKHIWSVMPLPWNSFVFRLLIFKKKFPGNILLNLFSAIGKLILLLFSIRIVLTKSSSTLFCFVQLHFVYVWVDILLFFSPYFFNVFLSNFKRFLCQRIVQTTHWLKSMVFRVQSSNIFPIVCSKLKKIWFFAFFKISSTTSLIYACVFLLYRSVKPNSACP